MCEMTEKWFQEGKREGAAKESARESAKESAKAANRKPGMWPVNSILWDFHLRKSRLSLK